MSNALNWFEVPVKDLPRAVRFYESVLAETLKQEIFGETPIAVFTTKADTAVGGALIQDARRKPSTEGSLVYLNAAGKLDACLARVDRAGGAVLMPKTDIGPPGFIALIRDSEGNTVGLHSPR